MEVDGNGVNSFNFVALNASFGETLVLSAANLKLSSGINLSGASGAFTVEGGSFNDAQALVLNASEELVLIDTTLTPTANISGAGTIVLEGSSINNTGADGPGAVIYFDTVPSGGPGNTLSIQPYAHLGPIEDFGQGDTINVGAGNTLSLQANGNGTYSLIENQYTTISSNVTLSPGLTPADFSTANGVFHYTCFLAGTLMTTARGDVPVEEICAGDELVSGLPMGAPLRKVVWVGKQFVNAAAQTDKILAYPVRIMVNALADGVPERDLLVTPEHCLWLEGRFVPARMLVNGRSIISDSSFAQFYIYHVETEPHSVIIANGALTESYLDTGNRRNFTPVDDESVVFATFGHGKSWEIDAAAPLSTARDFVEPIFHTLAARAVRLGAPLAAPEPALTEDADVYVLARTGKTYRPIVKENDVLEFALPANGGAVRLCSRASKPAETVGPYVDDRRELGIKVAQIAMIMGGEVLPFDPHITDETLRGWHAREPGEAARWTNGDALLPIPHFASDEILILRVQIIAGGPYKIAETEPESQRSFAQRA